MYAIAKKELGVKPCGISGTANYIAYSFVRDGENLFIRNLFLDRSSNTKRENEFENSFNRKEMAKSILQLRKNKFRFLELHLRGDLHSIIIEAKKNNHTLVDVDLDIEDDSRGYTYLSFRIKEIDKNYLFRIYDIDWLRQEIKPLIDSLNPKTL